MSNAVFGKTMENLEKRVNIEVITSTKIAKKRIAKRNFKRANIFRHDLVGVHMIKAKIILNRPLQVGFTILDISKTLMYNFNFNIWMKRFPSSKLLFTDTDSLAYVVDGDVYQRMATFQNEFDFSEYPKDHPLYDPKNMKVLAKMKDGCHGQHMLEFGGLRPKLYAIKKLKENGTIAEDLKAKGVPDSVRKTQLHFSDYKDCVKSMQVKEVDMNCIRSDHHKLYTYNTKKIGLSAFDDKRFICSDGISTLAHGHTRSNHVKYCRLVLFVRGFAN